jgi:hypothetical protein
MSDDVSILIPNRNGHEALELCLESIWRRTRYAGGSVEVVVFDSPGDGRDRPMLERWADAGKLRLLRGVYDKHHGEALTELLRACETPVAVLLESDCEVRRGAWLDEMRRLGRSAETVIAVARFFPGVPHGRQMIAPVWGPECLWLDMEKYRPMSEPHDWQQRSIKIEAYKYADASFGNLARPLGFDGYVNLDTSWRFTEKLLYENAWGYSVAPLPSDWFRDWVHHFGGISTRGARPEIAPRWHLIRERLRLIRGNE